MRTAGLLRSLPPERRDAGEAALREELARYAAAGGGIELPAPALLVSVVR